MKKNLIMLLITILLFLGVFGIIIMKKNKQRETKPIINYNQNINYITDEFNLNLAKTVNIGRESNYLISPYSIEIALNMLKDGANGKTKEKIESLIGGRFINNISVKDRISLANAIFIKNKYKEYIKEKYTKSLVNNYNSEILYDDFKTPQKINNWVKNKTNGMIDKILDDMSNDFVIGLANALAIDVKWNSQFECTSTTNEEFTKINGETFETEMMHKKYSDEEVKYISSDSVKGIIIPYIKYNSKTGEESFTEGKNLEFIAIMPNNSLKDYINSLSNNSLNSIIDSAKYPSDSEVVLSIPRFTYDFSLDDFKEVLKRMGMNLAFDEFNADFTNMFERTKDLENIYVGEAIHKTHIELSETGTKAAAVTYFGMFNSTAILDEKEKIYITLNKPFMYIIRDTDTKEMLFFGTVYEPNKWNGSTCKEK